MKHNPLLPHLAALAFAGALSAPALAHEMWIEPAQWQLQPDSVLTGDLIVGQDFQGLEQRYNPREFERFSVIVAGEEVPVEGRLGDRPALSTPLDEAGLATAVYVSGVLTTHYTDYDKFSSFVAHKALPAVLDRHAERGLAADDITEAYRRYAKALVAAGDAEGADSRLGLKTELVALENPYGPEAADGVDVELWYNDAVVPNYQIEVFEKASPDGEANVFTLTTDVEGRVTVPVKPGHTYLVDSVQMREPDAALQQSSGAVWESLWASLTFRIP